VNSLGRQVKGIGKFRVFFHQKSFLIPQAIIQEEEDLLSPMAGVSPEAKVGPSLQSRVLNFHKSQVLEPKVENNSGCPEDLASPLLEEEKGEVCLELNALPTPPFVRLRQRLQW